MKVALMIGATGLVGSQLLGQLLNDPRFDRVIAYTLDELFAQASARADSPQTVTVTRR